MLALFSIFFLLSFRVDLLIVCLIVLGCQHGAFLEPKIDQHATYVFFIFIDFLLVFPLLLRLGRALCWFYIGSFFASFFASIFGRFGVDFGAILGAFGRSKSVIFGIDF